MKEMRNNPVFSLVSDNMNCEMVTKYCQAMMENADEGSEFEQNITRFKEISNGRLPTISEMLGFGYNGILMTIGNEIIAHVFWQSKDTIRVFSVFVNEENRNQGYATKILAELVKYARGMGIVSMQIGKGRSKVLQKVLHKFAEKNNYSFDFSSNMLTIA